MSSETDFAEWHYASWVFVWLTEGVACFGQTYKGLVGNDACVATCLHKGTDNE